LEHTEDACDAGTGEERCGAGGAIGDDDEMSRGCGCETSESHGRARE